MRFDAAERKLRVENQDRAEVRPELEAAQADAFAEIQEFHQGEDRYNGRYAREEDGGRPPD
jgi:hypothetical protein